MRDGGRIVIVEFEDSIWLAGLIFIPLLILYSRYFSKRKYLRALEFSKLSVMKAARSGKKTERLTKITFSLGLIAIAFIFIGLAGPQVPLEQTKEGVNIVFALDTSGSMKAADYQPDRITAAKEAIGTLIDQLDPKDYAGIITFDSGASTAAYLSPDKQRVNEKLGMIAASDDSTAIGDGLALAVDMSKSIPNRKSVVILLSDGESNTGYVSPQTAAEFAKESGVQVFTVAMGSSEKVLVGYDWANNPQYATMDEETLEYIADSTGGGFYSSVDEKTLGNIYSQLDDAIVHEKEKTPVGWLFFLLAGLLVIAEYLIRYGRWRVLP